ncbi:hypothetical protein F511_46381 [Dorcoceras hygrometricum]|uniref:Uncharacterized protein n=1 Tax=Dorcoceras hygrometricum TaxID=472368 RepID=A0A2Z7A0N5_9LAMI|nr:hypothetical protein F511_46381 [Dorcoceras hygrometricum]
MSCQQDRKFEILETTAGRCRVRRRPITRAREARDMRVTLALSRRLLRARWPHAGRSIARNGFAMGTTMAGRGTPMIARRWCWKRAAMRLHGRSAAARRALLAR